MKKKSSVLLLGLIIVVSGWWTTRGSSRAAPAEGVLDVWATWGDPPDRLQEFFDAYSQASGIPVTVTSRVRSDDLLEAMAGPEQPDLVILSSVDLVRSYHDQGLVEPLGRRIKAAGISLEEVYPALLQQCRTADGETLCLPWGGDVDALFWNQDLFAAAGLDPERPPRSLEELTEYASRLSVRNEEGEISQAGFVPDLPRSHLEMYVRMFGGSSSGEPGSELTAGSQPLIEALNWQLRFYDSYPPGELEAFVSSLTPYMSSSHPTYGGKRLSCQQCHRSTPIQNKKSPDSGFFQQGRIAMMIDGQWQLEWGEAAAERAQVKTGVAPLPPSDAYRGPANGSVVQGPVLMVPAAARDRDAAVQLLAWMMSPQRLADAAYANATLPASRVAAQDPRFRRIPNLKVFMDLISDRSTRSFQSETAGILRQ